MQEIKSSFLDIDIYAAKKEKIAQTKNSLIAEANLTGTIKEISELQIGMELHCIKGYSHPNMGRIFAKGQKFKITDIIQLEETNYSSKEKLFIVGGWRINFKTLQKHFTKVIK